MGQVSGDTEGDIEMTTNEIGKLITTHEGKCRGPRYGEVYTAPAGEKGFVAGYRSHANRGLGLIGREWFATQKEAQDYAVQVSDN